MQKKSQPSFWINKPDSKDRRHHTSTLLTSKLNEELKVIFLNVERGDEIIVLCTLSAHVNLLINKEL